MHTILVPLDGSPTAETVLPHVMPLAARFGSRVVLLAVHEPGLPSRGATGVPAIDQRIDEEARGAMGEYLQAVAHRLATEGLTVDTVVLQGVPSERIAWYAASQDVQLVALATHGRGGFTRLWLGSVTDRVLRHVEKPMFVVRADGQPDAAARPAIRRVLVPLDGTAESEAILAHVAKLMTDATVECTLLRIAPPVPVLHRATGTRESLERDLEALRAESAESLARAAERFGLRKGAVRTIVRTAQDPARAILATAAETGADVIALMTHAAGSVERIFVGSVADEVMRGSPVPVLMKRMTVTAEQPVMGDLVASESPGELVPTR